MKQHKRIATLLGLVAAGGAAWAGEEPMPEPAPVAACNWCDLIKAPGKPLYENPDNAFIQSFKFFGRAQLQYAYIDGEDVNGDDFNADFEEIRRLRFGAEIKAFKYFKVKANMNLENDMKPSGGDRDIGYDSLDEALIHFDAGKAFGIDALDSLSISAGRHKVLVGAETHQSSKKIKSVERSAVANKLFPERMTGVTVHGSKGNLSGVVGVFSTDSSREIADFSAGEAYYANLTVKRDNGDQMIFDFLYNAANGDSDDNQIADNTGMDLYEWAFSAAYEATRGKWGLVANAMIGDNGDNSDEDREGMFYGFVVIPTYEILPEKLEAAGRFSILGAEDDEGIRSNSRYLRRDNGGDTNSGRGDTHFSMYGGLNYYICGDNMKIMTGIEWETLDTPDGDVDAFTYWLAYRMYF